MSLPEERAQTTDAAGRPGDAGVPPAGPQPAAARDDEATVPASLDDAIDEGGRPVVREISKEEAADRWKRDGQP